MGSKEDFGEIDCEVGKRLDEMKFIFLQFPKVLYIKLQAKTFSDVHYISVSSVFAKKFCSTSKCLMFSPALLERIDSDLRMIERIEFRFKLD